MLPAIEDDLTEDYEVETQPSLTWKLDAVNGRISGTSDGKESIVQAIYCILNTERYDSMIHSWDYGVELKDLFGEPLGYVLPELKRRITEALLQDDRIQTVDNFVFDIKKKGVVSVSFTVGTNYGEILSEKEVEI
ncbi:MAG: DUF2634 domain-containing protein [Frisingicoccus sp.]|nr:DUF2634 domain-containing protein [Bariatricus sp.]MDY5955874.1 DUF2634 domain-containing protein [Frisingicoccus sp.]